MTRMLDSNRAYANRRVTGASIETDRLVADFQSDHRRRSNNSRPSRTQALQVAKRYASAIGLKAAKIALIDQLFAFTKAIDWSDAEVTPVVWPSNDLLARRLGIKASTLKHHLTGLVEAGMICYSDHPTYQRRGRRSEDGRIAEAYGINLSPIAARYREFLQISDAADFEAGKCKRLSNRRTLLRRSIAAIAEAARRDLGSLDDGWDALLARLDRLRECRPKGSIELEEVVDALEGLHTEAADLLLVIYADQDFDSAVSKIRPLQTTAQSRSNESCKGNRKGTDAQCIESPCDTDAMAYENKPSDGSVEIGRKMRPVKLEDDIINISLPLLRSAFVHLREMVPEIFDHWAAFRKSGGLLCRLCYVNPQVYQQAVEVLGQDLAIVALALTVERNANGSVSNPGGYLRELTNRSCRGTLRLSRSLFGMAAATQKTNLNVGAP